MAHLFGPDENELLGSELLDALASDPTSLDRDFLRLPGLLAYHAACSARAMGAHLRAKAHAERLFGLLQLEQRERMLAEGLRPTESQVAARALVDPRMIAAHEEEIRTAVEHQARKGVVGSLQAKRDMLIQLGAQRRAEMEHDPIIRDRVMQRRTIED